MITMRRRILLGILPLTSVALIVTAVGLERAVYYDLLGGLDSQLLNLVRTIGGSIGVEVDGGVEFELSSAIATQFTTEEPASFYEVIAEDGSVVAASAKPAWAEESVRIPACSSLVHAQPFRVCAAQYEVEPDAEEEDIEDWSREHPGQTVPKIAARKFWVEVGMSLSGLKESLGKFRARLATGFGALFLVLVAVPVWSVRRALLPVGALSKEAEGIHAANLGARLTEVGVDAEVRSLVAALNRALDRVSEAYERQTRFTADAAHELRTPLSVIRTQSDVALRKRRDPAELVEALMVVQKASQRLTHLMESLLLLSRHDSGAVPLAAAVIDLGEVMEDAVHTLSAEAEAKGVSLEAETPESIDVWGDAELLTACVVKLVENAVRFTPQGGTVRVEASSQPSPRVSVQDTGPGLSPEDQSRIFERFYRVDRARSRGIDGGTGLGLSIAREIARLHGGEIKVFSEPGKGSRFELILPVHPQESSRP